MAKRHVLIPEGGLPATVLAPGDPGRVPVIGGLWQDYREVSFNREFRLARGWYEGVEIAACSTGIGGPSSEIALVELAGAGVRNFIRVGTCASLQAHILPGDIVIQDSAVRLTGCVDAYVGREFPSVADREVTWALVEACDRLGVSCHVGMTASTDSFFAGQGNEMAFGPDLMLDRDLVARLSARRVATFEMEAAVFFALGSMLGLRTGSLCAVGSNRVTGARTDPEASVVQACRVASLAGAILAGWDAVKVARGLRHLTPSALGLVGSTGG